MKSLLLAPILFTASALAEPFPIPTLPAMPVPKDVDAVVSTDKSAQFKSVQEAVDAAPDNATKPYVILVKPGRYRWQQTLIPKSKRFIIGPYNTTPEIIATMKRSPIKPRNSLPGRPANISTCR